jgi:ParB family chromosome partitioning protein
MPFLFQKRREKMNRKLELNLPSANDLFSTQEERDDMKREKVMDIPLTELHPFKDHPFQVTDNDELRELAKSIAAQGVVTPALARPCKEGGYELISGHRRKAACEILGITTMPVIIRELDDDAATMIMVDSNQYRENILPSEKAFAYKMKLEAMKRQAGRPKNNSVQVGLNFSRTELSIQSGESQTQIQRYIRLTNLIPKILTMVDEKQIAFSPAVELSYLPKKAQEELSDIMSMQQCTPSLSQAIRMKELHQKGKLCALEITKIMGEQKANQKDRVSFRADAFSTYFPKGYTPQQMEKSILTMLEERKRKVERMRDDAR